MSALEYRRATVRRLPLRPASLPRLAVVIPALNEGETVGAVVSAVPRIIPGVGVVDVIVVNDGSTDNTHACALAAGADSVCAHTRPRGLVEAFKAGVHEALRRGASIVVNLDADGQHDPAFIPSLVAPILDGSADLVVGVRPLGEAGEEMTTIRRQGNRVGSWVAGRALGLTLSDATSGYRAFSREALLRLNVLSDFTYTLDTIIDASRKRMTVAEVAVPAQRRLVGQSRMTHSIIAYIRRTGVQAATGLIKRRLPFVFGRLTGLSGVLAVLLTGLFLWRYQGGGAGRHLPALLASLVAWMVTVGFFVCAMLASGIDASRRMLEDALYAIRRLELGDSDV